jgi:hypothetical protein
LSKPEPYRGTAAAAAPPELCSFVSRLQNVVNKYCKTTWRHDSYVLKLSLILTSAVGKKLQIFCYSLFYVCCMLHLVANGFCSTQETSFNMYINVTFFPRNISVFLAQHVYINFSSLNIVNSNKLSIC